MVGWTFGLNLEVIMSSEHLRKPKKVQINIALSVGAVKTFCENVLRYGLSGVGWLT